MTENTAETDILWAHHCIRQAMERYCRGCDRIDRALITSAFWPDAVVDMGPWVGPATELADLLVPIFERDNAATLHLIAQANIEVQGDSGCGDTYFIGHHRRESGNEVSFMTAYGRYVDRFEKRNGEWRIARRTVVMEHLQNEDDVRCGDLTMDMFRRGRRSDRSDLSYEGRSAR